MAIQQVNLGATGTGAGGDSARTAFEKLNANFSNPAHAANRLAQTSATDTTAGALMAVGAFGLGIKLYPSLSFDFNELPTLYPYSGRVPRLANDQSVNGPVSPATNRSGFWYVDQYFYSTGNVTQVLTPYRADTDGLWIRNCFGNVWSAWRQILHSGNILGTVSQSGGVPTGAIIERGSNANGEYVRFADGTQICWTSVTVSGANWRAAGGKYYSPKYSAIYAAAFVSAPIVSHAVTDSQVGVRAAWCPFIKTSASALDVHLAALGTSTADVYLRIVATGRWY